HRMDLDLHRLALAVGRLVRAALPEPPDRLDAVEGDLLPVRVALRGEDEVVGVPADGEGDVDPAVGEVVHHRPFLGDADRMVKRHHDAAGAQPEVLRGFGEEHGQERRIREDAAELVEVALGDPDPFEAVLVRELRALPEEVELPPLGFSRLAGEEEQAERRPGHWPGNPFHRRCPHMYCSGYARATFSISSVSACVSARTSFSRSPVRARSIGPTVRTSYRSGPVRSANASSSGARVVRWSIARICVVQAGRPKNWTATWPRATCWSIISATISPFVSDSTNRIGLGSSRETYRRFSPVRRFRAAFSRYGLWNGRKATVIGLSIETAWAATSQLPMWALA